MNTHRDAGNRQRVSAEEVQRLRRLPGRHSTGGRLSARNRLAGRVASVEADGVMALVEIQVGTDRITAAHNSSVRYLHKLCGLRGHCRWPRR